ncbi:MAG: SDR family NAD(P)-dependent oxidoreductase [Alphaproteobacteria bacterium]|nr:SDR family NAD(P)-dependent oxidoreductase [Alphaproteobacteria bacterium]
MADVETAIVVGVGPGLGAALGRCFAGAGMRVALAARNRDSIAPFAAELGDMARAYACDATDEAQVEALFEQAEAELGAPSLVAFNAGAFVRKGILETETEEFERCWRVGCLGGFLVGRAAARGMTARGRGTIVFTGATASLRGGANFHNLAVPKFGLRALAQSMARELGPKGVHVAHVIIDGQILSDRYADLARERPEDGLLSPDAIASNYLHLHRQHRSAWSQEIDLRPWVEKF